MYMEKLVNVYENAKNTYIGELGMTELLYVGVFDRTNVRYYLLFPENTTHLWDLVGKDFGVEDFELYKCAGKKVSRSSLRGQVFYGELLYLASTPQ